MSGPDERASARGQPRFPILVALILGAIAGVAISLVKGGDEGFGSTAFLWHGLGGALFFFVVASARNRVARRSPDAG